MAIKLGGTIINKKLLGVNSLNKIMLGAIEIFPNLALPVNVPITIAGTQSPNPSPTPTNTIPFDTSTLEVGDTVFLCTRSDAVPLGTVTVPGATVTLLQFRQNGFVDSGAIHSFVVPAGMPGTGIINITTENTALIGAVFIIARGGSGNGITVAEGGNNVVNVASFPIIPTVTDRQAILIAMGTSTTTNPGNINSFTANQPVDAEFTLPRLAVTALAVIMDTPATVTVTQSPTGSGQIMCGIWMTTEATP